MLLADGIVFWFVGLIMLGMASFFGVIVMLVARVFGFVVRQFTGTRWDEAEMIGASYDGVSVCPHPGCGERNPAVARYCGRCGRPLARHGRTHG